MGYDPMLVAPMREELVRLGVKELCTADEVDGYLADAEGTTLVVVNSVCGCAAGSARPGLSLALGGETVPDRVCTVFAGQDTEATERARSHFGDLPPSSPCFALLKDGDVAHFTPRHAIEGRTPEAVAELLAQAFEDHCGATSA